MSAHAPRLKIRGGAEVPDDTPAGVIEEQLAILGAAHRDYPFEVVTVLEQIVDCLRDPTARNYRNLRPWEFFLFLLGHLSSTLWREDPGTATLIRLRMPRDLSQ